MAKYSSADLKIEIDNSGGTPVDLSAYIDTIDGFNMEALTQESTPFGVDAEEHLAVGISRTNPVTVEGFYDDTAASGPDAVLNSIGDTRTLTITWDGDSNSDSVEAIIQTYNRTPTRGELTRFSCTLLPTGAVT